MNIIFSECFKKNFNKLPLKIQNKFEERLDIFIKNSDHPLLKMHPLKGILLGFRAFSVTGDFRVIFKIIDKETIKLVDIGPHSRIYGK